jgi:hypothetical protein
MNFAAERKLNTLGLEDRNNLPGDVKLLLEKSSLFEGDLGDDIVSRICELAENSRHVEGILRCVEYGKKFINALPGFQYELFSRATALTDIGKVGDVNATKSVREACVKIYAITNSTLSVTRSLDEFCEQNFITTSPEFWSQDGMSRQISRREFYNLHVLWGVGVLKQANLQKDVIQAAARHHAVEGYGHPDYISEDGRLLGNPLSITEIMVMLIDKYDAARDRSGKSHQDAIRDVSWRISQSQYASNENMLKAIKVLENTLNS